MSDNDSNAQPEKREWLSIDHRLDDDPNVADAYFDVKNATTMGEVKKEVKNMRYNTKEEWIYVRNYNFVEKEGDGNDDDNSAPPAPKRRRTASWKWNMLFRCHRSGFKQERNDRDEGGDSEQPRSVQKESKKVSCEGRLKIYFHPEEDVKFTVFVKEHSHGCEPGSIEEVRMMSLSKHVAQEIRDLLDEGKMEDVRQIRLHLQKKEGSLPLTERDKNIGTVDVYNVIHKWRVNRSQKHADDLTSVNIWLTELEQHSFSVWRYAPLENKSFSFAISSPWQKHLFQYAMFLSIDATHHATGYPNGLLYTIVIRHPEADRGVPISYLFTTDQTHVPLVKWFADLKAMGIKPKKVTIDYSLVEKKAIETVWDHDVSIQYCTWHVFRAWIKQYHAKASSKEKKRKDDLVVLRGDLKMMMYERDQETFQRHWKQFKSKWKNRQKEFFAYFKSNWIDDSKYVNWTACHQPVMYNNMATNNYVESWHNQLKTVYLKRYRVYRLDDVLHLIAHDIEADLKHEVQRRGYKLGRMTNQDRETVIQAREAQRMDEEMMMLKITFVEDGKYQVASFNNNAIKYDLVTVGNRIESCSCLSFLQQQSKHACKHMYILRRRYDNLRLKHEHSASYTELPISSASSSRNNDSPSHNPSAPVVVTEPSSSSPPIPSPIEQADANIANDAADTNNEPDLDAVKAMMQRVRHILNDPIPGRDQAALYARTIAHLEAIHADWESHVVVPGNT